MCLQDFACNSMLKNLFSRLTMELKLKSPVMTINYFRVHKRPAYN